MWVSGGDIKAESEETSVVKQGGEGSNKGPTWPSQGSQVKWRKQSLKVTKRAN